jgi:manganese oxidase
MLSEWKIVPGTRRPDPNEMTDFNMLTLNAKAFPGTAPMLAKLGERVRLRIGNLSSMSHHPMHIHGHAMRVIETDGGPIPEAGQWQEVTVLVPVGSTRTVEFIANNPGDLGLPLSHVTSRDESDGPWPAEYHRNQSRKAG